MYLFLLRLDLDEGLGGVLVDGGEEEVELLHAVGRLEVERDEARVHQLLDQQPVLHAGHVVAWECGNGGLRIS